MKNSTITNSTIAIVFGLLAGCGDQDENGTATTPEATVQPETVQPEQAGPAPEVTATGDCNNEQGLTYICGPQAVEDLLALGSTGMILGSGMSNATTQAHMYLIDPGTMEFTDLIHSPGFTQDHDTTMFPNCPGPLNLDSFSVHGLSVFESSPGNFSVYTTSHGEREAIEVYELNTSGPAPTLAWKGCVVLPANTFANSVARLADGGFVTTKMMDPAQGFSSLQGGAISGNVFEWHPGTEVVAVEGTELSGANGIAVSEDERYMYVAAIGSREVIRFDRSTSPIGKQVVSVDISPDNIRWGVEGKLLTAGNNYVAPDVCSGEGCATGWSVLEIDAETLAVNRIAGADQNASLQGVSSALQVGDTLWVGTFNDDRVAKLDR
ncbi:MAG: SMP-30/gluconolactonase/LRE family protein [Pseudomonadota bacterium]